MVHSISESVTQVNSEMRFAPAAAVGFNKRMKTNEEIRVENLRALIREAGSEELLAARYKCTPAFIKQMSRGYRDSDTGVRKGIGTAAARKLEECMGSHKPAASPRAATSAPTPTRHPLTAARTRRAGLAPARNADLGLRKKLPNRYCFFVNESLTSSQRFAGASPSGNLAAGLPNDLRHATQG